MRPITTRAPAKVILFGEHAVNRGQPALATSVGLYVTCASRAPWGRPPDPDVPLLPLSAACVTRRVSGRRDRLPGDVDRFQQSPRGARCGATGRLVHPAGGGHHRAEVLRLGREIDAWRAAGDLEPIRRLAGADYFAPAKYVLAGALGEALPGPAIDLVSEVPAPGVWAPAGGLRRPGHGPRRLDGRRWGQRDGEHRDGAG